MKPASHRQLVRFEVQAGQVDEVTEVGRERSHKPAPGGKASAQSSKQACTTACTQRMRSCSLVVGQGDVCQQASLADAVWDGSGKPRVEEVEDMQVEVAFKVGDGPGERVALKKDWRW